MLHPSHFQSAKPYFQILRAVQTSNDIFRLYILYIYYTKHLSPCPVLSISICTSKGLWKTQNGFLIQPTQDFTLSHMVQSRLYWPPNKLAELALRLPVLQHFPLQAVFLTRPLLPSPRMDVAVNVCAISWCLLEHSCPACFLLFARAVTRGSRLDNKQCQRECM